MSDARCYACGAVREAEPTEEQRAVIAAFAEMYRGIERRALESVWKAIGDAD